MLVFIVLAIGLAFRSIGGKVKRAGNDTVQNFDGNAAGGGGAGAAGGAGGGSGAGGKNAGKNANKAGGSGDQSGTAANGDPANGGGGAASAGGGGGGGASKVEQNGSISDARQDEASAGPSYTRILAIVFMILFVITAFFAFRKGKSQAAG